MLRAFDAQISGRRHSMVLRKLIQMRSRDRGWVYILCGTIVVLFAFVSVGMEGSLGAGVVFLPFLLICIAQFQRPTLLLWAVLTLAFVVYTVAIVAHFRSLTTLDLVVSFSITFIPSILLLWARPRADLRA